MTEHAAGGAGPDSSASSEPAEAADSPADLRARLAQRLASGERRRLDHHGLKRAAVTLVIVPSEPPRPPQPSQPFQGATGERRAPAVILTRRASSLRGHAGQYALPGGRLDPGETVIEAALRELHEEVGLALGENAVLGRLDDFVTRSGYHMAPVVVWGWDGGPLVANPAEVAEIHRVPLARLARPETVRTMAGDRPDDDPLSTESGGRVLALHIVGTLVFAPTAALLLQLGELAVHGRWRRVAHFEQPRFAWS